MRQLHRKIEAKKHAIYQKKHDLSHDYEQAKERLTSKTGLSLTTLSGMALGFLLMPKKFRILRSLFKAYTMAATLKGFLELMPGSSDDKQAYAKKRSSKAKDMESI